MTCHFPRTVYYNTGAGRNPATGKYPISFKPVKSDLPPITIPCGQCIGCRIERSRQWATRCVLEASLWTKNCFITLTYDDEHLPENGTLVKKHFQDFMKRLRKKYGEGIRFFHCGEYGSKGGRPHYHACLFNFDFPDKYFFRISRSEHGAGSPLYRSPSLEKLWTFGFSTIGEVTFESAAYVARYVLKKITGKAAKDVYLHKIPEYVTMSRKPGIAKPWYDKFKFDVYPLDTIVIRGNKKVRPPKYFDNCLDDEMPLMLEEIKAKRIDSMMQSKIRWIYERYPEFISIVEKHGIDSLDAGFFINSAKNEIQKIKLNQLKRSYENES